MVELKSSFFKKITFEIFARRKKQLVVSRASRQSRMKRQPRVSRFSRVSRQHLNTRDGPTSINEKRVAPVASLKANARFETDALAKKIARVATTTVLVQIISRFTNGKPFAGPF